MMTAFAVWRVAFRTSLSGGYLPRVLAVSARLQLSLIDKALYGDAADDFLVSPLRLRSSRCAYPAINERLKPAMEWPRNGLVWNGPTYKLVINKNIYMS